MAENDHVEVFNRRGGTVDVGKDYEDINAANVIFRMVKDEKIKDFLLSSNDEKFGDFDDIVIKVTTDENVEKKIALQLKHSGRPLTIKNLTEGGKDFSIQKYVESYKKINEFDDSYKLIIFTNRKFIVKVGEIINFAKLGFSVTILKADCEYLISTGKYPSCYKFDITQINNHTLESDGELRIYKEFFEKFYLYTDQEDSEKTEKDLSKEFQEEFHCSNIEFHQFKQFVTKWNKRTGNIAKLNKKISKRVIALSVLSLHIKPVHFESEINKKMKLFRMAIDKFNLTIFDETAHENINKLWGNISSNFDENDSKMINIVSREYQLNFSNADIGDCNKNVEYSKALWLMNKIPLVIIANDSSIRIIQMCEDEKFVLIGSGIDEQNFAHCSVFKCLSDLKNSELYDEITREFTCSIQERKNINLQTLLHFNEKFEKTITTNELLEMSLHNVYNIGGTKEVLPVPYIERSLAVCVIDFKYILNVDSVNENVLIVINCKSNFDRIKNELTGFKYNGVENATKQQKDKIFIFETFCNILYIAENECTFEYFEKIRQSNVKTKIWFHFNLTKCGNLNLIRCSDNIINLKSFCQQRTINEKEIYSSPFENLINLIVAEPGMGKSVLLKSLKNNLDTIFLIIIMLPADITSLCEILNECQTNELVGAFRNFVLEKKSHNNMFNRAAIEKMFKNKQIICMWDAIDEILSTNVGIICKLIRHLSKLNIYQWVSCRTRLKKDLEKKLNVFSKSLRQLENVDQLSFVEKRLSERYPTVDNTDATKNIMSLINLDSLLRVPLQIYMLTEMFRENKEAYSNISSKTFNIIHLYEYFLELKFNIYIDKSCSKSTQLQVFVERQKELTVASYQEAGLQLLCPTILRVHNNKHKEFMESVKKKGDPFGILYSVTEDNLPVFIHFTFAEYFVASYFVKHFKTIDNFENILFRNENKNIRFYFDMILAKNSQAHVAVLYKNFDVLTKYDDDLKNLKDLGGRTVLHLAASWGQNYPVIPVKKSFLLNHYTIDDAEAECDSIYAESHEYIGILQCLAKFCTFECDILGFSPLSYAEKTESLLEKTIILHAQGKQFSTLKDDLHMARFLYYSAKFGYDYVINLYKKFPCLIITYHSIFPFKYSLLQLAVDHKLFVSKLRATRNYSELFKYDIKNINKLLHIACEKEHGHIVKILIKSGADVNNCDLFVKRTPLHYACKEGHEQIARLLIESKANVNVRDRSGSTPLYYACEKGYEQIARLLVESEANVNICDKWNGTPLHYACKKGYEQIARLLIESEVNVDVHDGSNSTPLHYACEKGHEHIARLLIEFKADVNICNNLNRTPLHLACEKGYEQIARLLIESESNVNICDNLNRTPLHHACEKGYEQIARLLIESEANVNICDNLNRTPLHYAYKRGYEQIARLLIESEANVNICDKWNMTPLHYAYKKEYEQIARLLIEET